MNFKLIFFVLFSFLLTLVHAGENQYPDKTISKALKFAGKTWDEPEISLDPLKIDPLSGFLSPTDTLFRLVGAESRLLGYLAVSSAKGRFDYFDFMVVYTRDLDLVDLRVLVYRSDHGSQVSSRAWLKQFYGSPPYEDKIYGSDINALSGATFSAKSLTMEINRLNKLLMELAGNTD